MPFLSDLAMLWGGDKSELSVWLGVGDDGLHAMVGTLLLLLLAVVTGRRMDDWRLWLVVVLVECANEVVDLSAPDFPEANWAGSIHDLVVTLLVPTAILLLLRFTDRRRSGAAADQAAANAAADQAAASAAAASEANSAAPSVDG